MAGNLAPIPNEELAKACQFPTSNQFGPKIDFIIRTVAKNYKISYADILSARRTANIVLPRQIAMYLSRTLTLRSLPEIGRRIGNKDHTTVLHGARKIASLIENDSKLAITIAKLTAELTA